MSEDRELKQRAIELLSDTYQLQKSAVAKIEPRLAEYYDDLCEHSSVLDDDENDRHNCMELLGAIKFLRLLRTYEKDMDTFRDVIWKYEGKWERRDGIWYHVEGGLKHPGLTGAMYYRLQPFQVYVLASMFLLKGWINTEVPSTERRLLDTERVEGEYIVDLRRLCTEFTLFCPRKVAKTQLSAFIQFYYFMSGDENAECYCCANSSDQAKILFNRTKDLIHQMDPREKRIRFTASQVNWKSGQFRSASLTALSAGGRTKDGLAAQLCSADEFGSAAYVNGRSDMGQLVSVVESSMGFRREPMSFYTTTAGINSTGPFIDKLDGIKRMLKEELDPNAVHDISTDRQMCLLLMPDEWEAGDEEYLLTSKAVRRKVNPMLSIIVQHSFYEDEIAKARLNPEKKNEVISKLFNVYQIGTVKDWLKADEIRVLQVDRRVDDCKDTDGWVVFCGLDFSRGDDLNGVSYLCINLRTWEFFGDMDSYVSEEAVNKSPLRELYLKWAEKGWLHIVPGKTFDPAWPVNRIIELNNHGCNFCGFGYDPYNAKVVMNALGQWVFDIGLNPKDLIVPVRQNYATYNPAVNEFDYMVKRGIQQPDGRVVPDPQIKLSMNPMWPWQFANCVLQESNDGMKNVKPVKRNASDSCKVDNVQMLLSALLLFDMKEAEIK